MVSTRVQIGNWLSLGKQVGATFNYLQDDELIWSSVGLQKIGSEILVYYDEIFEKNMACDLYSKEEYKKFSLVEHALDYVESLPQVRLENIKPCKGQRIFNPSFSHTDLSA